LDTGFDSPGVDNGSGSGIFLFRPLTKEEWPVNDLLERRDHCCRLVPSKCEYYSFTVILNMMQKWFFWGFSLAFSDTANLFIGDLRQYLLDTLPALLIIHTFHAGYFGLNGVMEKPSIGSVRVPSIVFCVYQLMFAAITYVHPNRTTTFAQIKHISAVQ